MANDDDEIDSLRKHAESLRKLDEGVTFSTDYFPRLWRRYFERLIEEGFSETQSLELVKTYIISQGNNATKLP